MTLANKLTILRILLIPVFIITYIRGVPFLPLAILAVSMLTDFLDGTVARQYKQRTELGALLDPTADKLFIVSVMLTMALLENIPLWVFIVFFSKDFLLSIAWFLKFVITGKKEVTPRLLGKICTTSQMILLFSILLKAPHYVLNPIMTTAVMATIAAGLDYIITGSKTLN